MPLSHQLWPSLLHIDPLIRYTHRIPVVPDVAAACEALLVDMIARTNKSQLRAALRQPATTTASTDKQDTQAIATVVEQLNLLLGNTELSEDYWNMYGDRRGIHKC